MIMLLLNGFLEKIFPERLQISLGLLILSLSGTAPFWYQAYPFVFGTRILFGLGVGMINAKAISIISERYQGKTRIQMLGLRGSAEGRWGFSHYLGSRSIVGLWLDSYLSSLQCWIFGTDPLSALCTLWKGKERSQEKSEGSKSLNSRNERLDFYLSY